MQVFRFTPRSVLPRFTLTATPTLLDLRSHAADDLSVSAIANQLARSEANDHHCPEIHS